MKAKNERCRNWSEDSDYCDAMRVLAPRSVCEGCKKFEPNGVGLGDVVEKVISVATLGTGKRIAKKVRPKGGCGCDKRRSALNRLSGAIIDKVKGTDHDN